MKRFVINAFDGDGASSAGGEAMSGEGQVTTVNGENNGVADQATGTEKRPFDEVIKEYKDEYSDKFQKEWNARHKDYMTNKTTIKDQGRLIERMALKYGIEDVTDLKAIEAAMQEDDDLIASRAMQNGLSVEQQRKMDDVELENRRYREEQKEMNARAQAQRQYDTWMNEANSLKAIFPNFDFDAELQNDEFRRALGNGISVERAFYMLHGAEIAQGAMQYTAQAVRKATEDEIANKPVRPRENGTSRQASAKVSTDVHNLSRQERQEIAKRALKGERIYL